jgi:drug/metabolite transporter (DMT)-like permease
VGAAVSFGFSLYATARVSAELPVVWALLPARVVGVLLVALPLALTARLRLTRRALPLVVASGIAEVLGFALFAIGSRHGIAVSAVLASQFGAIAGVAAFLLFRERLARIQLAGVVMIVVGVSVLSVLQT